MGGVYTNKALLLDEREIEAAYGYAPESFDDLYDAATEFAETRVGADEHPFASYLGCSSERFDATELRCYDQHSSWLEDGQVWTRSLGRIMQDLGDLDPEVSEVFFRTGEPQDLIATVSQQATVLIAEERFSRVRDMMTALENLKEAGLPCFRNAQYLTAGGDDDAYDLRERDWGAGRRVIVEMAFVWG
ncbi:hypothetical protein [Marinovum sp.]|uniref:hypothetical protein n=1 Tax=Marinovum sp. TaxID=2024839 RepID=UPI003A954E10